MGTLWRSCMKVREQIELPFGAGSGVGPVIGVLDGGLRPLRGNGGFLGVSEPLGFLLNCFQWCFGFIHKR